MGQDASVLSKTEEVIRGAVTTNLSAVVDSSANANCSNIQSVEGVRCCKIEFTTQTCQAAAINEVISVGRLDSQVTQGIATAIEQAGKASTEGLAGAITSSSEVNLQTKRNVDIAINTAQTFETDCSKNATGLNQQSVKDSYCGCGDEAPENRGVDIKFAPQEITLEAVGTCVSDIVGSSSAAQDYSSWTGQTGEATVTGINLLELFLAMIGPLMIFIIAPIGFKILTSPTKKPPREWSPQETAAMAGIRVGKFAFLAMIFFATFWWPGLAAWFLGAPPFFEPRPILDNNICNPEGGSRRLDLVVNRFQWYDPDCASRPPGTTCTEEEKYKAYETCGIFSKAEVCKDPQFKNDRDGFREMQRLCAGISGFAQNGMNTGTIQELTQRIMKQDGANPYGRQCRVCFSNDPEVAKINGLYASIDLEKLNDPNDTECKYSGESNKQLPARCYQPCDKISPSVYLASGLDANGQSIPCEANESVNCFSDPEAYLDISPGECQDGAYMEAKKKVSKAYRAIEAVETLHRQRFPDETPEGKIKLSDMCEANPFKWMDCNPDYSCNYTPSNPNNEFEVKACANDFEGCQDTGYLMDKEAEDIAEDYCAKKFEEQKKRDTFLGWIPIVSMIFYGFLIAVTIVASIYGTKLSTEVARTSKGIQANPVIYKMSGTQKAYAVVGQSNFFQFVLIFLCIAGIGAGVAFILVDDLNPVIGYVLCAVFGLILLFGTPFIFLARGFVKNPQNAKFVSAYE